MMLPAWIGFLAAGVFLTATDGTLRVSGPGAAERTLLEDEDFNWILDWSSSSALVSGNADGSASALLLVKADGTASVLSDRAGVARFSPDGQSILYTREYVLHVRRLADAAPWTAVSGVLDAEWSPDGRSIVITRIDPGVEEHHWLALFDLRSGTVKDLTGRPYSDWRPFFHPSGDWILFASTRDPAGYSSLWRIGTDGTALARVTEDPRVPLPSSRAIWSPDGRCLAFDAVNDDGSRTIWMLTFSEDGVLDRAEPAGDGIPYSWESNGRLLTLRDGSSPAVLRIDR